MRAMVLAAALLALLTGALEGAKVPDEYLLGRKEMAAQRYKRAIKYFGRADYADPDYPYSIRERGTCYYYLKQYEAALYDYRAYLRKVPGDAKLAAFTAKLEAKVAAKKRDRGFGWRTAFQAGAATTAMGSFNSGFSASGMEGGRLSWGWGGGLSVQAPLFKRWLVGPEFEYFTASSGVPKGAGLGPVTKADVALGAVMVSIPVTRQFLDPAGKWKVGVGVAPSYVWGNGTLTFTSEPPSGKILAIRDLAQYQGFGGKLFVTADRMLGRKLFLGTELGFRFLPTGPVTVAGGPGSDPFFNYDYREGLLKMLNKDGSPVTMDFSGAYLRLSLGFW